MVESRRPDTLDDVAPYFRALPRGGRRLPAGHHGLMREFVVEAQRRRMLDAIAHAVAEKGYERTAVADVLELAGVSRKTFYEHFTDKQECFIAAYQGIFGDIMTSVVQAYQSRRRWPDRMSAGLAALLQRLAAEPAYARSGIVEVLAAGPQAIEARDAALAAFRTFFDPTRPEVPHHEVPPIVAEATIGGIYEVMYRRVVTVGPESLPSLHPELLYLALAPYISARTALRESGLEQSTTVASGHEQSAQVPNRPRRKP